MRTKNAIRRAATHMLHKDASAYATDTLTPCFNVAESNSELSNHRSKPTELATEIVKLGAKKLCRRGGHFVCFTSAARS